MHGIWSGFTSVNIRMSWSRQVNWCIDVDHKWLIMIAIWQVEVGYCISAHLYPPLYTYICCIKIMLLLSLPTNSVHFLLLKNKIWGLWVHDVCYRPRHCACDLVLASPVSRLEKDWDWTGPRLEKTRKNKTGQDWRLEKTAQKPVFAVETCLNQWFCIPNLPLQNKPKITQNSYDSAEK